MERELLYSKNNWKEIQEVLSLALMCLPAAEWKRTMSLAKLYDMLMPSIKVIYWDEHAVIQWKGQRIARSYGNSINNFLGISTLFSELNTSFYNFIHSVQWFQFLHILENSGLFFNNSLIWNQNLKEILALSCSL